MLEIQTDQPIQAKRFCYTIIQQSDSERRPKYLNFAWELKKLSNMNITVIIIAIRSIWNSSQESGKGAR